jgi:hypothetical protein
MPPLLLASMTTPSTRPSTRLYRMLRARPTVSFR